MRVVLDANVLVSALISRQGSPGRILDLWENGAFDLAASAEIIDEVERVIRYPKIQKKYRLSQEEVERLLGLISSLVILVKPGRRIKVIAKDPTDNRYLECAKEGQAAYIVTGDKHLLELKEYEGIVILPPAGFLALINLEKKTRD
ncbi:MAG: putative toxin-antitoxin system toxin component, PIN family [Anaerolineales bacterium]|nr:putative toxin-antitoxin system toxin component, PIN family [Anaerolineales bacterium]